MAADSLASLAAWVAWAAYPGDRAACAKSNKPLSGPARPGPPDWNRQMTPYFYAGFLHGGGMGSCCPAVISVRPGMWAPLEVFLQI